MPPHQQALPPSQSPHPLGTEVFTTAQVAQALHLSVRTILRAIKSGKLTARRTGKQFLITRDAVQTWPKHQLHGCGNYWILLRGDTPNLAAFNLATLERFTTSSMQIFVSKQDPFISALAYRMSWPCLRRAGVLGQDAPRGAGTRRHR